MTLEKCLRSLFIILLTLVSIAASADAPADLISRLAQAGLADPLSCTSELGAWHKQFVKLSPGDLTIAEKSRPQLIGELFRLRLSLTEKLASLEHRNPLQSPESLTCIDQVRQTLVSLRSAEDELILAKQPASTATTLVGQYPQLLLSPGAPSQVKLRSGDVLLSRGNAFVSAAISRITKVETQFSHLTQVYIDAAPGTEISVSDAFNDPRVFTIEAHIEVGSFTRPFRDYVTDANARVVQYRPRQSANLAHAAAQSIFIKIRAYQDASRLRAGRDVVTVNDNPPYDFQMNLNDDSEIFCAEIVALAQRSVGVSIPRFQSRMRTNDVTNRIGITASSTFAPADIEIDPAYELLAEWRDVNKLTAIKVKDAVFHAVYSWMDQLNYGFHPSATDKAKAALAWSVRQTDKGFLTKLPKNMSTTTIALTFVLDRVGSVLENRVLSFIDQSVRTSGRRPSESAIAKDLELFRAEDALKFKNGYGAKFHWDLR